MDLNLDYSKTDNIQQIDQRQITTRSQNIAQFTDIIYTHCKQNKLFEKLQTFSTTEQAEIIRLGNTIDNQLTKGISKAIKLCSYPITYPWSIKLHKASLRVKYWKLALATQSKHPTPALKIIQESLLDLPLTLPS